jgi:thiol-disulfide isomerase/thioredoxin
MSSSTPTFARRSGLAAAALAVVLAACGSTSPTGAAPTTAAKAMVDTTAKAMVDTTAKAMVDTTAKAMVDTTVDAMVDKTTTTVDAMVDKSAGAMADLADWQKLAVTDVRTGQAFMLGDVHGTPVYVENFATWCPNCRQQLGNVEAAAKAAGDKAVFVALSVETDLSPAKVAAYAKDNGFDHIRFAVMTPELLAAMSDAFGKNAINPPSTPHLWVSAEGKVGQLATGFEDAAKLAAGLDASMMHG